MNFVASSADLEWKISPRRGDGNLVLGVVLDSDFLEWKISPRRGDGNFQQHSIQTHHHRMEDKSPKRGRKLVFVA